MNIEALPQPGNETEHEREPEITWYERPLDLIEAFESSDLCEEALEKRVSSLRREHPSVEKEEVRQFFRSTREYLDAFRTFWHDNRLRSDEDSLHALGEKTYEALNDYFARVRVQNQMVQGARSRMEPVEFAHHVVMLEQARERLHMIAALALTDGLAPTNEDDAESEASGTPPPSRTTIGRHLVMYLAEGLGIDKADPLREEVKLGNKTENRLAESKWYNQEARS